MEEFKPTLQIKGTKDYAIFKVLPGNRIKTKAHVQELMQSFETLTPLLREARPIIVNEEYEIIDGQHSLEAAIQTGEVAWFVIVPGLKVTETRAINSTQKGWTVPDYVASYALEIPDYKTLMEIHEEYPVAYTRLTGLLMFRAYGGGWAGKTLRTGKYRLPPLKQGLERLQKLKDFEDAKANWMSDSFALAVIKMLNNESYNHAHMIAALEGKKLDNRNTWVDYLRDLEIIYNKASGSKYVKFI